AFKERLSNVRPRDGADRRQCGIASFKCWRLLGENDRYGVFVVRAVSRVCPDAGAEHKGTTSGASHDRDEAGSSSRGRQGPDHGVSPSSELDQGQSGEDGQWTDKRSARSRSLTNYVSN